MMMIAVMVVVVSMVIVMGDDYNRDGDDGVGGHEYGDIDGYYNRDGDGDDDEGGGGD